MEKILVYTVTAMLFLAVGHIITKSILKDNFLKKEYTIELVNQNSIKVKPMNKDTIYTVHPDSLVHIFEFDNQ